MCTYIYIYKNHVCIYHVLDVSYIYVACPQLLSGSMFPTCWSLQRIYDMRKSAVLRTPMNT